MKAFHLLIAAGVLATGAATTAHAQDAPGTRTGFYGAIGYSDVAPKSGNGKLAGAFDTSIDNDWEPSLTLGYRLPEGWGVEAWLPITRFQHDVSLNGAKSATIEHMPILVTGQYHFRSRSAMQPFVGLGYGWVNVSDEHTEGPIAGTTLNVDDNSGVVGQLGVDYFATDRLFVRVDAKYFKWKSDVKLNGVGIGQVDVDPWIYGVSVGYTF